MESQFKDSISSIFRLILLPLFCSYKWLVAILCSHGELETIIMKNGFGYRRTIKIEKSLQCSNNIVIRDGLCSLPLHKYVKLVSRLENVKSPWSSVYLKQSLVQIRGYRRMMDKVDALKNLRFNAEVETHVTLLKDIWNSMIADEPFSLKSKRWSDIGFQGSCPATDFRGMGMFAAENFRYFVKRHKVLARTILSSSLLPDQWYPFAVVGINLTVILYDLLHDGTLKTHFYNSFKRAPKLNYIHIVYETPGYHAVQYLHGEIRRTTEKANEKRGFRIANL